MKNILFIVILFSVSLFYSQSCTFSPFRVYLDDADTTGTNIRKTPNGNVILKLNQEDDYYMLYLIASKNGWFKIESIEGVDYDNIMMPGGGGWIHHSVIAVSTRKDIILVNKPDGDKEVGKIERETNVKILDICENWVQIKNYNLIGWVNTEWLCGNPVTTCP